MKKYILLTLALIIATLPLSVGAYNGVSEWAREEINVAELNGVIPPSFEDKDFGESISRENFAEVCVVLYEALTECRAVMPEINPFLDTDNTTVTKAYELGVINGVTNVTFEPTSPVTREQAAAMLRRVISLTGAEIPNGDGVSFTDAEMISEWAMADVCSMAAMNVIKGREDGRFAPWEGVTTEEAVVISGRLYIGMTTEAPEETEDTPLADAVPAISFGDEQQVEKTENSVTVTVGGVTLADYNQYIIDVQGYGYNDVENIFPDTFIIANNGINRINVSFGNGVLKIVLTKMN